MFVDQSSLDMVLVLRPVMVVQEAMRQTGWRLLRPAAGDAWATGFAVAAAEYIDGIPE
jgi:hypothetical protein